MCARLAVDKPAQLTGWDARWHVRSAGSGWVGARLWHEPYRVGFGDAAQSPPDVWSWACVWSRMCGVVPGEVGVSGMAVMNGPVSR